MPSLASLLVSVITSALSTFLTKLLSAIGVSIFSYGTIKIVVNRLLDLVQPYITGLPSDLLSLMALAGVGEALTILASALVSRAVILAAKTVIGQLE